MAKLLITAQEIVDSTIISGDVDVDKYNFSIENVEIMILEPLLGTELFDKIKTDNDSDVLSGLYLTLYNDYLKPILKYKVASEYIDVSSYSLKNGGIFKHSPDSKVIPERTEIEMLSGKYDAMAQVYIERFNKWISKNILPEYKTYQDEVDAESDLQINKGWYFGSHQYTDKWG